MTARASGVLSQVPLRDDLGDQRLKLLASISRLMRVACSTSMRVHDHGLDRLATMLARLLSTGYR